MASILETFYILFQSNTDQIKKGTADAEHAAAGLTSGLGAADAAGLAMGEHLISTFKEVAFAVAAAFSAERLADFIKETAEVNAQLGITAERLGIAVEDLDAWQQATERAGGSSEGFTQSLDFLNRGIADIATKGTSRLKPFFDELKIKVTDAPHHVRPLLDILGDLSDKLSGLSAQQRAGIAEKLGLDEGTVLLLAQGRRGVEDLVKRQKELGVATAEDAEKAHKFNQSVEDLEQRLRHIATEIGSGMLPRLQQFFQWAGRLVDYLANHKGLVEGFFIGVAGVVTAIYLPSIISAIAATVAFLAPWALIIGAVLAAGAAVAFLVDDIENFMDGNRSVIGEVSKTWPIVGEVVTKAVKAASAAIKWFVDTASAYFGLWKAAINFAFTALEVGFNKLIAKFPIIGTIAKAVGDTIVLALKSVISVLEHVFGLFEKIPGLLRWVSGGLNDASAAMAGGNPAPSPASGPPEPRRSPPGGRPGETPAPKPLPRPSLPADHPARAAKTGGHAEPHPPAPKPLPRPSLPTDHPARAALGEAIKTAHVTIQRADTSPVAALARVGAAGQTAPVQRNYKFTVENLTVQTQATDAAGMARTVKEHLEGQMRQAMNHFDDGVRG